MNAPSGPAPLTTPNAKPIRAAGADSWRVVIIRPLLPRLSELRPRPSVKNQTLRATADTARPAPVAANDRMMSGLRPKRSASTPQKGRNSSPMTLTPALMRPTATGTSSGATPIFGRWSGVNAESWPYAMTSMNDASVKRVSMRRQPEGLGIGLETSQDFPNH